MLDFLAMALFAGVTCAIPFWGGMLLRRRSPRVQKALVSIKRLVFAFTGRMSAPDDGHSAYRRILPPIPSAALALLSWMARALHPCYEGVPPAPLWTWPSGTPVSRLRTLAQGLVALMTIALVVTLGPLVFILLFYPLD